MKQIRMVAFLFALAVGSGCVSYPSICHSPSIRGRVVYSCTMIFPDKTKVHEKAPVPNVPILVSMGVCNKTPAFGDGGPHWKPNRMWHHYTFADTNGCFSVPMQWGIYIKTRGLFSNSELVQPQFAILEPTSNVITEGGEDKIWPYRIIHPGPPLQDRIAELRKLGASPIHWGDRKRLREMEEELKKPANKPSDATR